MSKFTMVSDSRANLILNGNFDANITGWIEMEGTEHLSHGAGFLQVVCDGDDGGRGVTYDPAGTYSAGTPVTAGHLLLFSCWVHSATDGATYRAGVEFDDAPQLMIAEGAFVGSRWTNLTGIFQIPTGSAAFWPTIQLVPPTQSVTFMVDNVVLHDLGPVA